MNDSSGCCNHVIWRLTAITSIDGELDSRGFKKGQTIQFKYGEQVEVASGEEFHDGFAFAVFGDINGPLFHDVGLVGGNS